MPLEENILVVSHMKALTNNIDALALLEPRGVYIVLFGGQGPGTVRQKLARIGTVPSIPVFREKLFRF